MDSQEQKEYRLEFSERLLRAAGCVEPTPYVAMLASYLDVEPTGGGHVEVTVVDPETHAPLLHQPFGERYTVHDLLIELATHHPAIAPNAIHSWRH